MKKILGLTTLLLTIFTLNLFNKPASADAKVYRIYNPTSGEHFYTTDLNEYNSLISAGWNNEGIGWYAPDNGNPVYRMYNPNSGVHFFTVSIAEVGNLLNAGWSFERVSFNSGGFVPIYRAYNPNSAYGLHNFTSGYYEQQSLINAGWRDEGVSIYATAGNPGPEAYIQSWNLVRGGHLFLNTASSKWSGYFPQAINKWNAIRPNTIFDLKMSAGNVVNVSDVSEVSQTLATTYSNFSMTMNDYQLYSATDMLRYETITHELGHGLGLDHYPSKWDLMYNMLYGNTDTPSNANISQLSAVSMRY